MRARSNNVAKLMRERSVSRFVIAPSGYGKTFLLLDYCRTVDDFEHTMWLDASSPCFLNELDKGTLASDVISREVVQIVVFDNLPHLSSERADCFSRAIDDLLAERIEVMVSCRPSCDAFAARQKDRICLRARDLVLSDDEVSELEGGLLGVSPGNGEHRDGGREGEALIRRIPQFAWDTSEKAALAFAKGIVAEELPDEMLAVEIMALVLGSASVSWACNKCSLPVESLVALRDDYPHFGISFDGEFEAIPIGIEALDKAFSYRLEELSASFGQQTRDEVLCLLADMLVENGNPGRACDLLSSMASQKARIQWLGTRGELLFKVLCVEPAWRLCETLYKLRADKEGSCVEMHQAWRIFLLGDSREAFKRAVKVAARPNVSIDVRAWCLLLMARIDQGEVRQKALQTLSRMLPNPARDEVPSGTQESWVVLAICLLLAERRKVDGEQEGSRVSEQDAVRVWRDAAAYAPSSDIAFLSGAYLLEACPVLASDELFGKYAALPDGELGAVRLDALRKVSELISGGSPLFASLNEVVGEDAWEAMDRTERLLMVQQREFSHEARARERRAAIREERNRVAEASDPVKSYVPQVHVSLFGGVSVVIGGRHLEEDQFTKTKMRALLALLVMACGREVSRDRVIGSLWPSSTSDTARKNLYGNWSELVRVFTLPDGTCPYLHRVQGSYRIDKRYVTSDVEQVSSICREMTMEHIDAARFHALLNDLDRLYQGEFVPAELKNEAIIDARYRYRNMVTDAWVHSTMRLIDSGERQMAMWTARKALDHERELEDPYFALMSAQVSCGQREAAMLTYKRCVAMLNRLYKMDPSSRMIVLYRQLVETEEDF